MMLDVVATPVRHPLETPFRTSKIVQEEACVVRVEVRYGDQVGLSEAAPQPENGETTESVLGAIETCAALLGDDPFALAEIEDRTGHLRRHSAALAGIDAALHDLCGKLLGQPTWRLLGLPCSGAPSMLTVDLVEPDEAAAAAAAWLRRFPDFEILKLKLGGDDLDVERVRAVRKLTDLPISVDANGAWSFDEAIAALDALARLGVVLVEQPLWPGDLDAVRLKAMSPLPLIADEECRDATDVLTCAARAHGVNVKLAECGGIRPAIRMIHVARALGLRVMLGCMIESGAGIAAALQLSGLVDVVDLDGNLSLRDDPWTGVEWTGGRPLPNEAPGLGLELTA